MYIVYINILDVFLFFKGRAEITGVGYITQDLLPGYSRMQMTDQKNIQMWISRDANDHDVGQRTVVQGANILILLPALPLLFKFPCLPSRKPEIIQQPLPSYTYVSCNAMAGWSSVASDLAIKCGINTSQQMPGKSGEKWRGGNAGLNRVFGG